jgi:hypothetical protein
VASFPEQAAGISGRILEAEKTSDLILTTGRNVCFWPKADIDDLRAAFGGKADIA